MKMRKAILTLHRKVDGKPLCICGSKLVISGRGWVCKRQIRTKESNYINVEFKPIEGVDLGRNRGDISCKVRAIKINGVLHVISLKTWMEQSKSMSEV